MQYREGTVSVTKGDNAVRGAGVDWTNIPSGALFAIPNQTGTFEVLSVVTATEITLTTPWPGPTVTDSPYWIVADFTPIHSLPLIGFNDVDAAKIVSTALRRIDGLLGGTGISDGLPQVAQSNALSTPPAGATEGIVYIVGANPTGAWSGRATQFASYRGGNWIFSAPKQGSLCFVADINDILIFRAGSWLRTPLATPKWADVQGKPSQYPPSSHNHPASQITGVLGLAQIPNIPATKITGVLDPSQIPVIAGEGGSINAVVSSGSLADLTLAQQEEIKRGTVVTTTDGFRWLYVGTGSKTSSGSYIQLSDVTPEWSVIAGKPSIFPTDTANVAGLVALIDAKVAGVAIDTSGLAPISNPVFKVGASTPALIIDNTAGTNRSLYFRSGGVNRFAQYVNSATEAGGDVGSDYVFARYSDAGVMSNVFTVSRNSGIVQFTQRPSFAGNVAWDGGNFNPATKADKTHPHAIADVTGLQAALDNTVKTVGASARLEMTQYGPTTYASQGGGTQTGGWARSMSLAASKTATNSAQFGAYGTAEEPAYAYVAVGAPISHNVANSLRVYSDKVTWGTHQIWHAGNLNVSDFVTTGSNTFNGVQKFKATGEPGMQILEPDELFGMRFGPRGGISFKEDGVWQAPYGNLKDFAKTADVAPVLHSHGWGQIEDKPTTIVLSDAETTFTANQTFKGLVPIRVQQSASTGAGWVDLAGVSANSSGSVVFRNAAFQRVGYIGNVSATTLNIFADVANIALNRRPTFAGHLAWDAGNLTPADLNAANTFKVGQVFAAADQMRLKAANNATGYAVIHRFDGSNYYFLLTANNNADGSWNDLRPFTLNAASGEVKISTPFVVNGASTTFGNIPKAVSWNVDAGDGKGYRLWDSSGDFSVYMSAAATPIWGGTPGNGHMADYNMYFRMTGSGRGFVFKNGTTAVASIGGGGEFTGSEIRANNWFRVMGPSAGIYWEQFGGGWQMSDTTWIRSYQDKNIVTGGTMQMGAFNVTSDIRLKTNIVPLADSDRIIDATNVYEFTKGGRRQYGVIAQEVREVAPILVSEGADLHPEDGDPILAVDLTGYIPHLIQEVKALRKRVAELEVGVAA